MNYLLLLFIHLLFGIGAAVSAVIPTLWVYVFLIYSIIRVLRYRNKDGWAHYTAAYLVGIEVLLRASHAIIVYEFGKYGLSFMLLLGLTVEVSNKKFPLVGYLYLLFMLPSILALDFGLGFTSLRKQISFNLSGPVSLSVSLLYFYGRSISKKDFETLIRFLILPLVAHVVVNAIKTPKLSELTFNLSANYQTSGGFGPNQVATIFGLGAGIIALFSLLKYKITGINILDGFIATALFGFAIFTFSRGGAVVPLLCVMASLVIQSVESGDFSQLFRYLRISIFITVFGVVGFFVVNKLSNDFIYKRFEKSFNKRSQKSIFHKKNDVNIDLSGREDIVMEDIIIFIENPVLGVGPGGAFIGNFRGKIGGGDSALAHVEITRMLAEHGIYGLLSLIMIISLSFRKYKRLRTTNQKAIFIFFILFAFGTMLHSAMRTALAGFIYGLAYLDIDETSNLLETKSE